MSIGFAWSADAYKGTKAVFSFVILYFGFFLKLHEGKEVRSSPNTV